MALRAGVETKMREIHLPQVFPTMSEYDTLTVEQWYVQEQDIVQPDGLLLEVDAPTGLIDIPVPPDMIIPHRVVSIAKAQGAPLNLGDLLITLEAMNDEVNQYRQRARFRAPSPGSHRVCHKSGVAPSWLGPTQREEDWEEAITDE